MDSLHWLTLQVDRQPWKALCSVQQPSVFPRDVYWDLPHSELDLTHQTQILPNRSNAAHVTHQDSRDQLITWFASKEWRENQRLPSKNIDDFFPNKFNPLSDGRITATGPDVKKDEDGLGEQSGSIHQSSLANRSASVLQVWMISSWGANRRRKGEKKTPWVIEVDDSRSIDLFG